MKCQCLDLSGLVKQDKIIAVNGSPKLTTTKQEEEEEIMLKEAISVTPRTDIDGKLNPFIVHSSVDQPPT